MAAVKKTGKVDFLTAADRVELRLLIEPFLVADKEFNDLMTHGLWEAQVDDKARAELFFKRQCKHIKRMVHQKKVNDFYEKIVLREVPKL